MNQPLNKSVPLKYNLERCYYICIILYNVTLHSHFIDILLFFLELQLFAKTTPTILMKNIDKSRRKILPKGKKKSNNSNDRRGQTGDFGEADSIGSEDDFGTTQIMVGSTLQEGQRTDRPFIAPSLPPPWVDLNAANFRHPSVSAILLLLLLPTTL